MQTNAVRSPGGRCRRTFHARSLAALGEAYLLKGRPDDALPLAYRALDVARRYYECGNQAWALRLLGESATTRDQASVVPAEEYSRQALTLGEGLGMRPLVAHCHLGLGTLYGK